MEKFFDFFEKFFGLFAVLAFLANAVFFSFLIYIALHFVAKVW